MTEAAFAGSKSTFQWGSERKVLHALLTSTCWHGSTASLVSWLWSQGKEQRLLTLALVKVDAPQEAARFTRYGLSRVLPSYISHLFIKGALQPGNQTPWAHAHTRHQYKGSHKTCGKAAKAFSKIIKHIFKNKTPSLQVMMTMTYEWPLSVATSSSFQDGILWAQPLSWDFPPIRSCAPGTTSPS